MSNNESFSGQGIHEQIVVNEHDELINHLIMIRDNKTSILGNLNK